MQKKSTTELLETFLSGGLFTVPENQKLSKEMCIRDRHRPIVAFDLAVDEHRHLVLGGFVVVDVEAGVLPAVQEGICLLYTSRCV